MERCAERSFSLYPSFWFPNLPPRSCTLYSTTLGPISRFLVPAIPREKKGGGVGEITSWKTQDQRYLLELGHPVTWKVQSLVRVSLAGPPLPCKSYRAPFLFGEGHHILISTFLDSLSLSPSLSRPFSLAFRLTKQAGANSLQKKKTSSFCFRLSSTWIKALLFSHPTHARSRFSVKGTRGDCPGKCFHCRSSAFSLISRSKQPGQPQLQLFASGNSSSSELFFYFVYSPAPHKEIS